MTLLEPVVAPEDLDTTDTAEDVQPVEIDVIDDVLVEEISIDGMCGVY